MARISVAITELDWAIVDPDARAPRKSQRRLGPRHPIDVPRLARALDVAALPVATPTTAWSLE